MVHGSFRFAGYITRLGLVTVKPCIVNLAFLTLLISAGTQTRLKPSRVYQALIQVSLPFNDTVSILLLDSRSSKEFVGSIHVQILSLLASARLYFNDMSNGNFNILTIVWRGLTGRALGVPKNQLRTLPTEIVGQRQ